MNNTYIFVASKNGIYIPSYEIKETRPYGFLTKSLNKFILSSFIPFNSFNKEKQFVQHFKQFYIKQLQYTASNTISNGNNKYRNNNGNETINPINPIKNNSIGKSIGPGKYSVAKQNIQLTIEKKNLNNEVNSLIELYNEMKNLGYFSKKKKEDCKLQIKQNYNNLNPIQKLLFLAWYIDNVKNSFDDNIFKDDNKNNDIIIVLNELSKDFLILNKINNDSNVKSNIKLIQKYIDINLNDNFYSNVNKKAQIIKEIKILNDLYIANIILFRKKGLIN